MDYENLLSKFIDKFEKTGRPIKINFKQLLPHLSNADRATHLIHTYPAKLLMHIPYFFLNNDILSKKGDRVLDSFCGSGTVLLEAIIAGRTPFGADANPLAQLISRTKTRYYDSKVLKERSTDFIGKLDFRRCKSEINVTNVDYWFLPHIKKNLASIIVSLNEIEETEMQDFFKVCFSNLVKKVSLADPRVSVPVKLNPYKYNEGHSLREKSLCLLKNLETIDIKTKLNEIINQNISRFGKYNELIQTKNSGVSISNDARLLQLNDRRLRSNSIQLFISSPPYSGAQKYIRSSSLSLGWLGLTDSKNNLSYFDSLSIGREIYNRKECEELKITGVPKADRLLQKIHEVYPKRAHISANYLLEMKDSLKEAVRVLKPGGYFVLVAANNLVCGWEFKTQEYLCTIAESLGLTVVLKMIDDIKSYGLMTKRNKTANVITSEWVMLFKKELE